MGNRRTRGKEFQKSEFRTPLKWHVKKGVDRESLPVLVDSRIRFPRHRVTLSYRSCTPAVLSVGNVFTVYSLRAISSTNVPRTVCLILKLILRLYTRISYQFVAMVLRVQ